MNLLQRQASPKRFCNFVPVGPLPILRRLPPRTRLLHPEVNNSSLLQNSVAGRLPGMATKGTKTDGSALLRRRHGMMPPGSAGVPPAQVLAQPRPSPPPGSTGNGARTLLRASPCRSRRQVARCRIAGKLSGTQRDSMRAGRPRSRGAPPPITLAPQGGTRRLAGPQPCRCGRAVTLGGPS